MYSLKLNIDENVYNDLEAEIRNKRLENKFGSVMDMISLALLDAIKLQQPERTLRYRKKRRKDN